MRTRWQQVLQLTLIATAWRLMVWRQRVQALARVAAAAGLLPAAGQLRGVQPRRWCSALGSCCARPGTRATSRARRGPQLLAVSCNTLPCGLYVAVCHLCWQAADP